MSNETTKPVTWQTEEEAQTIVRTSNEFRKMIVKDMSLEARLLGGLSEVLLSILDVLQKRLPPRSEWCVKPDED